MHRESPSKRAREQGESHIQELIVERNIHPGDIVAAPVIRTGEIIIGTYSEVKRVGGKPVRIAVGDTEIRTRHVADIRPIEKSHAKSI